MRYLLSVLVLVSALAGAQEHSVKPKAALVPNEATAISIAVAVLEPIYGSENIKRQRPLHAKLENGTWHVQGTLPPNSLGGVAEVWIARDDGRILRVTHGQ